jgi:hypothetical protein
MLHDLHILFDLTKTEMVHSDVQNPNQITNYKELDPSEAANRFAT